MFLISSWSLFQVQSYLPLSIVNYGISEYNDGSQVSDRRPLGYLFKKVLESVYHTKLDSVIIEGVYLSKALTCILFFALIFSCINKNCFFIKEADTFGHIDV